jgi:hypothetical protein
MSLKVIKKLAEIATKEFGDIVVKAETLHAVRLRLRLIDSSIIDILYPKPDKYSFNWRQKDRTFRINTAPHHPEIASFPRHLHYETEERILEDTITTLSASPEQNFRRVLEWVRKKLPPR